MPARKRAASAPPTERPGSSDDATPPQPVETTLAGEMEELPAGKAYESADEDDAPARVLEDEELVGHEDRAPATDADGSSAARSAASDSPTRAQQVSTLALRGPRRSRRRRSARRVTMPSGSR
jgi:hypothetical protein